MNKTKKPPQTKQINSQKILKQITEQRVHTKGKQILGEEALWFFQG